MIRALLFIIGYALGTIRYVLDRAVTLALTLPWILGWVLASGFGSTLFAVVFPPWGWYLIAERVLAHFNLL